MSEVIGIHTSAMLVELSISTWTGRKLDKKVSEEIDSAKGTKVKAGNYHKHLLAGNPNLDAILKYSANTRLWHTKQTLPWSDSGQRLLPVEHFMDYKGQLGECEENFNRLVQNFLVTYPTMVSAAAFQLGDLFDRNEYPEADAIAHKFRFRYVFSPVPNVGDWRIDTEAQAKAELDKQWNDSVNERVGVAMRDAWDRLHDCLTHLSDRLANVAEGERKVFRDTLVSNAHELVGLLKHLNITKDPKLESARIDLMNAIQHVEPKELRDSGAVRADVKAQVDSILNKFQW